MHCLPGDGWQLARGLIKKSRHSGNIGTIKKNIFLHNGLSVHRNCEFTLTTCYRMKYKLIFKVLNKSMKNKKSDSS